MLHDHLHVLDQAQIMQLALVAHMVVAAEVQARPSDRFYPEMPQRCPLAATLSSHGACLPSGCPSMYPEFELLVDKLGASALVKALSNPQAGHQPNFLDFNGGYSASFPYIYIPYTISGLEHNCQTWSARHRS